MSLLWHLVLLVLPVLAFASSPQRPFVVNHGPTNTNDDVIKVPLALAVMSRCPDGILCETVFDEVLETVRDIVNLELIYVGKLNASEPDFGVTCMHGPEECAGNVQQLCTAKYAEPAAWWTFVQCQNSRGRYEVGLPEVALKCAATAGIDWEGGGSGKCAGIDGNGKGAEGVSLLQKSVQATEQLGIKRSCTVLINGRQVCVHDSEWKECEAGHTTNDFVQQIRREYEILNGKKGSYYEA